MITISEILLPNHVNLALTSKNQSAGVEEILLRMKGDPRISDWETLRQAVVQRNAPAFSCNDCGICIAHGRTNAVHSLVMGAGRSTEGLISPDTNDPVRFVFVAGIPSALNSEYLRVVGTIARLCHDKSVFEKLLTVKDPMRFIGLLAMEEARL